MRDGSEEVVRIKQYEGRSTIAVSNASGDSVDGFGFEQRGYMNTALESERVSIIICDPDGEDSFARAIFIDLTGRAVGSRDIDDDGVHEDLAGEDLSC